MTKFSLTKGKSIFIIDIILIPVFTLVIYSGLKLHVVGHINDHTIWENWAHYHIVASIASLIVGWLHIRAHWGWYKSLMRKGLSKKSKTTTALSVLFLILIITGVILILFIDGGNSPIGIWHYRLGLAMAVLLIVHLFSRLTLLIKGLKRKKKVPVNVVKI